jgi:hypothetical protein
MSHTVKLSIVKTIQLRYEIIDSEGKLHGWNERYRVPSVAAQHWVSWRMTQWKEKKEKALGSRRSWSQADYKHENQLSDRLIRMATKKFKEVLA